MNRTRQPLYTNAPAKVSAEPADLPVMGTGMKIRIAFVFVAFFAFFGFVGFRLVQLQVLSNADLEALAEKQFQKVGRTSPHRLAIYDRNREELAVSVPASSVFVRPRLITDKHRVSRGLAEVLGGEASKWLKRIDSPKPFVWVQRQIPEEKAQLLIRKRLPGIFLEKENKRLYPNGSLAAHMLGFTDVDGNGISGLEMTLNDELLRKSAPFSIARDGKGNPSYIGKKYFREDDGETGVYVTLDRRLQHAVEEELDRALEETKGRSILAVVMDPFTGEIFSLGQRPTFDPNRAGDFSAELFTNRLISHLYEPGSTMKVIMASEALQQGLMSSRTPIDCEKGQMKFGKNKIREAESSHIYGVIPLEKVIRVSSNIGAVKVAQTLGSDRVRAALEKFGLTRKTGIALPGEVSAQPRGDKYWRPIFLATVGFGQGVSVTPLQMVSAFAPFANGGYLVRPRVLLRENISDERLEVRRVLTPSTVQTMRQILLGVTESKEGTGTLARIPNIRVAGKTGTAQKYESGSGYQSKKYFSSFIGFLPADRPELIVGVFVDEPKAPFYASQIAAPLFRRIAERSLQILDRLPKTHISHADAAGNSRAFFADPPARVTLQEVAPGKWVMPDLKGLSMREALRAVGQHVDKIKVEGQGYLKDQAPAKGALLTPDSVVMLQFSPSG